MHGTFFDTSDPRRYNALVRFLPWHRMFLLEFERELRRINANAFIPYWSWSRQREFPALARSFRVTIPGARVGPMTVERNPRTEPPFDARKLRGLPDHTVVEAAEGSSVFIGFSEALETAHNYVHGWIGGTMGDPSTSPADIAFWMHHAEVDRIWQRWYTRPAPSPVFAALFAVLKRPFLSTEAGRPAPEFPGITLRKSDGSGYRLEEVLDATNLGYGYDSLT